MMNLAKLHGCRFRLSLQRRGGAVLPAGSVVLVRVPNVIAAALDTRDLPTDSVEVEHFPWPARHTREADQRLEYVGDGTQLTLTLTLTLTLALALPLTLTA